MARVLPLKQCDPGSMPGRSTLKLCVGCKKEQELSEFHRRAKLCKNCKRVYDRNRSQRNKETLREHIRNLKEERPCMDCGNKYPWYVMDFDHVRGDKKFRVSAIASRTVEMVLEEIKKCDLVCSNCHRIRTFTRDLSPQCTL